MRTITNAAYVLLFLTLSANQVVCSKTTGEISIDASARTGVSSSPQLAVSSVRLQNSMLQVFILNKSDISGEALVKVTNLPGPAQEWDVYMDRNFSVSRTTSDLAVGIIVPLHGRTVNPADVSFFQRVKNNCRETVTALKGIGDGNGKVVLDICIQALDWSTSFIRMEELSRTTELIICPSKKSLPRISADTIMTPDKVRAWQVRYGRRIAGVRSALAIKLKEPYFNDLAARTLTPYELIVKELPSPNGDCRNRKILVSFTNQADSSVAVQLSVTIPDGMIAEATGKTEVSDLPRGESLSCGFVLKGSVSKDAIERDGFAVARVTLGNARFSAREKLPDAGNIAANAK